ncbi:MAG: hypothetical protein M3N08_05050 [Pseudomonadota bacterium]|nr:hypothetical protein [Pseudomonadota bacterium]
MIKISAAHTFFYKRIFPVIWMGFIIGIPTIALATAHQNRSAMLPVILAPLFLLVVGFFLMRARIFDLVDEVWDDGTDLVVKDKDQEARIALSDIMNISFQASRPPRATIRLRRPCCFGETVVFSPRTKFSFNFWKNDIIDDLITRIDEQRRKDKP